MANRSKHTADPLIDAMSSYYFCNERNVPFYDCILEARDGVPLFTNRSILAMHSRVFHEMLCATCDDKGQAASSASATTCVSPKGSALQGASIIRSPANGATNDASSSHAASLPPATRICLQAHGHQELNLLLYNLYFPCATKQDDKGALTEETALQLLKLADKFDMPHLLWQCEDFLCSSSFVSSPAFSQALLKWTLLAEQMGLRRLWNYCEYSLATMEAAEFLQLMHSPEFAQLSKESIIKIMSRNYSNQISGGTPRRSDSFNHHQLPPSSRMCLMAPTTAT